MTTIASQRRFRRKLIRQIGARSEYRHCPIQGGLLRREISRFLNCQAVQAATLYDIDREDGDETTAALAWQAERCEPVVARDHGRIRLRAIEWHHKPRKDGSFRKVCKLDRRAKMWHRMARDIFVAQHRPGRHIGDWPGRGRDAQMTEVLVALKNGCGAIVWADIRRAFASVNVNALYDLPYLPEILIKCALDHRTLSFSRKERSEHMRSLSHTCSSLLEMAPSGLLEGSPGSNAIFAALLDDLPNHIESSILVFCYCDNILLLAPTIQQAERAEQSLVRYLTGHRAGPFLTRTEIIREGNTFEHLGYDIRFRMNETPVVMLSTSNANKLGKALEDAASELDQTLQWLAASFPHCSREHRMAYLDRIMEEAAARRFSHCPAEI